MAQQLMDSLVRRFRRRYDVPAVGAALVDHQGNRKASAIGLRARGSDDSVLLSDKWHIGSCTKTITAALWARLVDSGNAEWDMPLPEVFEDLGRVDGSWGALTIRDLLNCRAGIPANFDLSRFDSARRDPRSLPEQRTELAAETLAVSPRNAGEFRYSNLGYIIVGAAIDRVSRTSFEEALHSHILEPLGVHSVGFGAPGEMSGHRSKINLGGVGMLKGPAAALADVNSDNPAVFSSAGSIHVSLKDWMTLLSIFLSGSETGFLSEESLAELFRVPEQRGDGMAMGWMKTRGGFASYIMSGSNTLWSATSALDEDRRRCAMVVCNDGRSRVLNGSAALATRMLIPVRNSAA